LYAQKGLGKEFAFDVFLVDDGSIDGTSSAIMNQFPEVNIIQGTGNLYWNRGMHLAWDTAATNKDFDYYLWLNDDTFLFENAFEVLFKEKFLNAIVCGTTKSEINKKATYGGYNANKQVLLVPNGEFHQSDYCNGNCVLIPTSIFNKIGNLDPIFQHALGDFDYSLRARKSGIDIRVAPEYVGFCESHDSVPKWRSNSLNVLERLKNLYSPLSGCYSPEFFIFDRRHNGLFTACFHFITIHLRCIFPQLWELL
jgi:GT2 family glycosyltransferase